MLFTIYRTREYTDGCLIPSWTLTQDEDKQKRFLKDAKLKGLAEKAFKQTQIPHHEISLTTLGAMILGSRQTDEPARLRDLNNFRRDYYKFSED